MQAVILAAGMGRRLGHLTENNTKCMLKVHGVTLIERTLDALCKYNISKVIVVVGYEGQNVIDLIGHEYKGLPIKWIWNHDYDTTNNIYSLYLAKDYLVQEDTLLLESDLIFETEIIGRVLESEQPNLAVVSKYESWMDGTVVTLDENDDIVRFIPKKHFSYKELSKYYKTVNIYKFSQEFLAQSYVPFLVAYSQAMGNNEYYEQVLRIVTLLEKQDLKAMRLQGEKWYEIDDIQDLDNAETIFAPRHEKLTRFAQRWGGYWRYPSVKDFCFLVNPYFPPTIMMDEMKAYFKELLSEYPSGQRVHRILAAKMFNCLPGQILLGNGAAELINALMNTLTGKVGVAVPTFHEYPNRVGFEHCAQLQPVEFNENLQYGVDDIWNMVEAQGVENFILINPDNPTGNYIAKTEVLKLAAKFQAANKHLVVDESFIDFSDENQAGSMLNTENLQEYSNMIVVKSISKSYGVPGIRLGVLACENAELLQNIYQKTSIWNINSFGEFFMQIYGKYEKDYLKACEKIRAERDRFGAELKKIDFLRVVPSQSNYFLCEVKAPWTSKALCDELLQKHEVLLKDCTKKPGLPNTQYVRISVRNQRDDDFLLAVLRGL
ncbi:MAG: aminotransferase class I/II-fold pyridoxal phosphate-dependent enzyme [Proteobacteria bacterium]|nr:aminotransferase class I/II-fold pyridoxal phosphate-dependent enzyme [Pseudomonadota bacterium]